MHVLLVEDDPAAIALVQRGLTAAGYAVTVERRGDEGLHRGATERFDLAIVDRMLPAMDGIEIVRRWRTGGVSLPVLLLTALGSIADRARSMKRR